MHQTEKFFLFTIVFLLTFLVYFIDFWLLLSLASFVSIRFREKKVLGIQAPMTSIKKKRTKDLKNILSDQKRQKIFFAQKTKNHQKIVKKSEFAQTNRKNTEVKPKLYQTKVKLKP